MDGEFKVRFEARYQELRRLAQSRMKDDGQARSIRPTSLVHAVYLRWQKGKRVEAASREEFLGIAAHLMRQVLVDQARAAKAQKRGGNSKRVVLEDDHLVEQRPRFDVLQLDEVLERLRALHDRQYRVVIMTFFAGMTQPEIARALDISERTVRNDWVSAQAWLHQQLNDE